MISPPEEGAAMEASTQEDLSRLRAIAEEGRNAPLLGGWHMILWGVAIALALLINWAVIVRILPWPGQAIAISWFAIVLVAWGGSVLLGRSQSARRGASTVGNRVERAVWVTAGAFLATLAIALFVRAALSGDPDEWAWFAIMQPVTFGVYAVALNASAVAGHSKAARPFVLLSLALAAVTALLIGDPAQYLVASAGVALVLIAHGIRQLGAERLAD
jgi:hypothetical protein